MGPVVPRTEAILTPIKSRNATAGAKKKHSPHVNDSINLIKVPIGNATKELARRLTYASVNSFSTCSYHATDILIHSNILGKGSIQRLRYKLPQ